MSFVACLPLIEADLPAVLALDQRALGGLWTRSGYQREIDSELSDLRVIVSAPTADLIEQRRRLPANTADPCFAAVEPTAIESSATKPSSPQTSSITLLGSGCLWAILEEAHITTLAIEPDYQGKKLGLLLLSDLLTCALHRGLTRATLEVRASNQKALSLYQKFHFKEAGQRKSYYADGENARILWRNHLQEQDCRHQITQQRKNAIAKIKTQYEHTVITDFTDITDITENLAKKPVIENGSAQTP